MVSLMNIAHENYFYGINELSEMEKNIIYYMTIKNTIGLQKETNQDWLNWYCAPFYLADEIVCWRHLVGHPIIKSQVENDPNFKKWTIEHIEKLHCKIENIGIRYLTQIRNNDLGFWNDEKNRDEFSFFLCNQYFRTKRMRDSMIMAFRNVMTCHFGFEELRPENMWLPLSLIFASNTGAHIAHSYSVVLLRAEGSCFLVGDQPVVNTHSRFDMTSSPDQLELFYPISPCVALLITTNPKYKCGQNLVIGLHDIEKYNALEVKAASEQVFSKDFAQLERLVTV